MTNQEAINELQSAIDLIKQDGKDWLDERDIPIIEMAIKALEAQEWVPCKPDTMPESNDEVLTTYIVNGNRKKRYVETATWYDDYEYGFWSSPLDEYRVKGTEVERIAWKPLPEPYREDGIEWMKNVSSVNAKKSNGLAIK